VGGNGERGVGLQERVRGRGRGRNQNKLSLRFYVSRGNEGIRPECDASPRMSIFLHWWPKCVRSPSMTRLHCVYRYCVYCSTLVLRISNASAAPVRNYQEPYPRTSTLALCHTYCPLFLHHDSRDFASVCQANIEQQPGALHVCMAFSNMHMQSPSIEYFR
jgi:hypothetical protein